LSTEPREHREYDELRGEGWTRLLAAARRRLEHTGGVLDGDIGLTGPSEAERRTVIGITGRYRPETAKRLAVPLRELDGYLHDRYGTGLLTTLGRLHGPLRDRPAERAGEDARREQALPTRRAGMVRRLAGADRRRRHPHPSRTPRGRTPPRRGGTRPGKTPR
jgi:hypothetical protein